MHSYSNNESTNNMSNSNISNNNNALPGLNWQNGLAGNSTGLPASYLGYIEMMTNSTQDNLNSSQTEKTWLNSSLNEKNFLNSSLNLPIEQRYNSLNEMVAKIIEDEAQKNFLANSTNNLNMLSQQQKRCAKQDSKKRDNPRSIQSGQMLDPRLSKYQMDYMLNQGNPNNMLLVNPIYHLGATAVKQPINDQPVANDLVARIEDSSSFQNSVNRSQLSANSVPFINNSKNYSIKNESDSTYQKLAYPASFSHQLATLSPDQQNFLLQQQNELVLALSATENFVQSQQNMFFLNNVIQNQFYQQSQTQNQKNNYLNITPNVNLKSNRTNTEQKLNLKNSTWSPLTNGVNFSRPQPITQYIGQNNQILPFPIQTNGNFVSNQFNFKPMNHLSQSNFSNINPDSVSYNEFYNHCNSLKIKSPSHNNFHLQQNTAEPVNSILHMNQLNEKLKYLAIKQPFRQHRRTVPANELHVNIEECIYQFKCLETERKKIETELSYLNIKPMVNSTTFVTVSSPRLSTNPSRVDRLIVDSLREHTKTCLLISRIENLQDTLFLSNIKSSLAKWLESIQTVQARRNDEITNNTNRQRLALSQPIRTNDDKDISLLANAVCELAKMAKKARTSLWSAWQIGLFYQQPNAFNAEINNSSFILNENPFTCQIKFDNLSKIFKIKTDLAEEVKT